MGIVSSILSPATKRVVIFLKYRKRVAKSFNPSWRDNQISALLVIICGPSLWYSWRRLRPPIQGGAFAQQARNKELARMRLKLVIAASLLAAIVGAGSCIGLVLGVFEVKAWSNPGLLVTATLLLPIAAIIFASIFVYRHTARRRKLQALLTAILATLLTLSLLLVAAILTTRFERTDLA